MAAIRENILTYFRVMITAVVNSNMPVAEYNPVMAILTEALDLTAIIYWPRVSYTAVRPNTSQYDKLYWRSQEQISSVLPQNLTVDTKRSLIQDVVAFNLYMERVPAPGQVGYELRLVPLAQLAGSSVDVMMFDTFYYFIKMPEHFPPDWRIHSTGGRFHPVPGHYNMPISEGTYTITGLGLTKTAWVKMNTRGGAEVYSHPFVDYLKPAQEYDAGWYKWFGDSCTIDEFNSHLYEVKLPFESEQCSV